MPMPIPIRRLRRARTALLSAALCLFGASLSVQAQEHVLYLSVVDSAGNPVTDIEEDDVTVQWDGENLETTEFEVVDWPVRLTVHVDNSDAAVRVVPQMREGLLALLRELPAEIEVATLTLARQPRWITRHTSDRGELEADIPNITPDSGSAVRFLDALVEEADRVDDDDDREYYPVVIMVSADGTDNSSSQQGRVDRMIERMVENSMEVHTLLFISGGGFGAAAQQANVGNALVQITRGSFERIAVGTAIIERLTELGRDIAQKHRMVSNQYRITYRQPRNPSAQPAIGVATEREGLQMIPTIDGNVPARMPGR
jgi:hypothetical protein